MVSVDGSYVTVPGHLMRCSVLAAYGCAYTTHLRGRIASTVLGGSATAQAQRQILRLSEKNALSEAARDHRIGEQSFVPTPGQFGTIGVLHNERCEHITQPM